MPHKSYDRLFKYIIKKSS